MPQSSPEEHKPNAAQKNAWHSLKGQEPDDAPIVAMARNCLDWLERFDDEELIPASRKHPLSNYLHRIICDGSAPPALHPVLGELRTIYDETLSCGGTDVEADTVQQIRDHLRTIAPDHVITNKQRPKGTSLAAESIDKPTLAMACLLQNPDIRAAELATKVGVSPSTLYSKSEQWKGVRQTLLARGSSRDDMLRGTKDAEGNLEAWSAAETD